MNPPFDPSCRSSLRVAWGLDLLRARRVQHLWSRVMGWVLLFTALQGGLGAWIVPVVSQGPATEVCTPLGMQWVALGGAGGSATVGEGADDRDRWPAYGQTCAWAMAHVFTPAPLDAPPKGFPRPTSDDDRARPLVDARPVCTDADRVLLNAPMRAPPPALA